MQKLNWFHFCPAGITKLFCVISNACTWGDKTSLTAKFENLKENEAILTHVADNCKAWEF